MNMKTIALLFICHCCCCCCFAAAFLSSSRGKTKTKTVARFGQASDWARNFGKAIGKNWQNSDWKLVTDAFREGLEESEINARARNAKPMEAPPPGIISNEKPQQSASNKEQEVVVLDAEILDETKPDAE
mmetsp:Transcript_26040/g.39418  ORF Transcript_26040/g.39418 Transcript_26040/m.39418 type:complete len:130 (-) Transcript_26040:191-580(-)